MVIMQKYLLIIYDSYIKSKILHPFYFIKNDIKILIPDIMIF